MMPIRWLFATALIGACSQLLMAADAPAAAATDKVVQPTVADAYPSLATGALTHARLAELPDGVLLRSDELAITEKEVAAVMAGAPEKMREQLRRNGFFVLERAATQKLLLSLAKREAARTGQDVSKAAERELIENYLKEITASLNVSDEEVAAFYNQNKSAFGGATLEAMKPQCGTYLLNQKQGEAVRKHIETLGRRMVIEVSAPWVKDQSVPARDNPVDKARMSGKPSMVDFGSHGCAPCDMMTPILETLSKKYEGKANVLFVHVGEEQVMAMRYGIESIPEQAFFDKDGNEVFRHAGFFPQEEIEKKFAEMGIK